MPLPFAESLVAADIDGDALDDAVLSFGNTLALLRNAGDGGFRKATTLKFGVRAPPPKAGSPANPGPVESSSRLTYSTVAVADVDRDGRTDLVATHFATPGVAILRGKGGGRFAKPVRIAAEITHVTRALVARIDANRVPHLVLLDGTREVVVLRGKKAGGYQRPVRFPAVPGGAYAVIADDVDGDGDTDLVVSDVYRNNVCLLRNKRV